MPKLRLHNFSMSLDGYGAGPNQGTEYPLGVGGEDLHEWMFVTKTWHEMQGEEGGDTGLDDNFMAAALRNVGATLMGRNMFGPVRGPWPDDEWRGWWGDNPPYHHPVFVLTHHSRDPIRMDGGTTFHFVTGGLESGLAQAFEAAQGRDVRLGGGASVVRQCFAQRLLDEAHIAIAPVLLGSGERLFDGLDALPDGYDVAEFVGSSSAAHMRLVRRP